MTIADRLLELAHTDERAVVYTVVEGPGRGSKLLVLLGINSDSNREEVKKACKLERLDWRSWWNGGGTGGPVALRWGVTAWPAVPSRM